MTTYDLRLGDLPPEYRDFIRKQRLDAVTVDGAGRVTSGADGKISQADLDRFDAGKFSPDSPEAVMFRRLQALVHVAPVDEVRVVGNDIYENVDRKLERIGSVTKAVVGDSYLAVGAFTGNQGHGLALSGQAGPDWIFAFDEERNRKGFAGGVSLSFKPEFFLRANLSSAKPDRISVHVPLAGFVILEAPTILKNVRALTVGVSYDDHPAIGFKQSGVFGEFLSYHGKGNDQDSGDHPTFDYRVDLMEVTGGGPMSLSYDPNLAAAKNGVVTYQLPGGPVTAPASTVIAQDTNHMSVHAGAGVTLSVPLASGHRDVLSVGADYDFYQLIPGPDRLTTVSGFVSFDQIAIGKERFGLCGRFVQESVDSDPGQPDDHLAQDNAWYINLIWHPRL